MQGWHLYGISDISTYFTNYWKEIAEVIPEENEAFILHNIKCIFRCLMNIHDLLVL
jgi:hypothetical protein